MTQVKPNELPLEVSSRLLQLLEATGQRVMLGVGTTVRKVEFANGQRLIVNYNPVTGKLWLAGKAVAAEFVFNGVHWQSLQDGSEFFGILSSLINELVSDCGPDSRGQVCVSETLPVHAPRMENGMQSNAVRLSGLLLLVLVPIGFLGFRYFSVQENTVSNIRRLEVATPPPSPPPASRVPASASCEPSKPANGAFKSFHDGAGNPTSRTEVGIDNAHSHDMVVFFTAPGSAKPMHSVLVLAGNSVTVSIPPGDYDLMFSTGSVWCSLALGYRSGLVTKLDKAIVLKPQEPVGLTLQSTGANGPDFQVFAGRKPEPGTAPPAEQTVSAGMVELRQNSDGHYYIEGSINGAPLRFLIDTGASISMLTKEAAGHIDLTDCKAGKSATANGLVDVCVGMIPEMRIGPYIVNNSQAAANPNAEINLLGMNVLSQFRISTEDGVMRLSKR